MILWTSYTQLKNFKTDLKKLYTRLLISNIVISMIPSTITLISQLSNGPIYYGNSFGFCGILPNDYEMLLVEIPLWSALLSSLVCVIKLMFLFTDIFQTKTVLEYKRALVYPVLMIILWLPELGNRLYFEIVGETFFPLLVLHLACTRIQGFINVIAFGKSNLKAYTESETTNSSSTLLSTDSKNESILTDIALAAYN